jgi:hypothetical protein
VDLPLGKERKGARMSKPGDKIFIKPTNIDWDDDASIDAWAQQVWLHAVAKREHSEQQQAEQQQAEQQKGE